MNKNHLYKLNNRVASALAIGIIVAAFPALTFASENSILSDSGSTNVETASSVVELSTISEKADNPAFFSVDVKDKESLAQLATDAIASDIAEVIDSEKSTTSKKNDVADVLEDSGLYSAAPSTGSEVDVTSIFTYQRLRLFADERDTIEAYGATTAVYFDGYYLLSYDTQEATRDAYDALVADYGQESVMIDVPMKLDSYGWGTAYMGMDKEQKKVAGGGNVIVAVLDSGTNTSHEIFSGKTMLNGYDFVNTDDDPSDDNGHGTMVAGIIAESTPSNVSILPIKVLDADGSGSLEDILMGLTYADSCGADISNMSLGGEIDDAYVPRLNTIFSRFKALMICAAGNESSNMDASGINCIPAELTDTVCVGAFDSKGNICSFSNYGSAVDFAAPGRSITLAYYKGGYCSANGTSFACPYVAAAAALVKAGNPTFDNSSVKQSLKATCIDMGEKGYDVKFGNGCPVFKEAAVSNEPQETPAETSTGTPAETTTGTPTETPSKPVTTPTVPRKITPTVTLSGTSYRYTGKVITPSVTVKDGRTILKNNIDYTVTYPSGRVNAGRYAISVTLKGNYSGRNTAVFTITKAANTMTISGKTAVVSKSSVKRKAQTVARTRLLKLNKPIGKVTYTKMSGNKNLKLNKTNGSITVKKGTKKGLYRIRIRATAAGNGNYSAISRYAYVTIRVR